MGSQARFDHELTMELRERGQRVTSQRLVIHRVVKELDRHVTAEEVLGEVADRLPGVSLPTVYATLALLEDVGMIRRVPAPGGPALFDPRTTPHHHAICSACGRVEDVEADAPVAPAAQAAERAGFTVRHAQVLVTGLCERCAA